MPVPRPTLSRARRRLAGSLTALTALGVTATGLAGTGALAAAGPTATALGAGVRSPLDLDLLGRPGLTDVDTRVGAVLPSDAQQQRAASLGAATRWNRYGTPQSMIKDGGVLASGLTGTPVEQARAFVRANKVLFRLTDADVTGLRVLKDTALTGSTSRVVMFRQQFGSLAAGEDGLITIGLMAGGKVAYVSSSAAGSQPAPAAATITAEQAWTKAAASVGRTVALSDLSAPQARGAWTTFSAKGFAQPQLARLVALPVPGSTPRAAFEVDVVDVHDGLATAFIAFVDARTGDVLVRRNSVDTADDTTTFNGDFGSGTGCSPRLPFTVGDGTKSLLVTAAATVTSNDIVLNVARPDGSSAGSSDNATSPEALLVGTGVVPGVWTAQVCAYGTGSMTPYLAPYTFTGTVTQSSAAAPAGGPVLPYPPKWSYFHDFPTTYTSADTRSTDCWVNKTGSPATAVPGCDASEKLQNTAARAPWDVDPRSSQPTFTTSGNAALTAQAWGSPLTPAEMLRPVSPTREYTKGDFPFTDQWRTSRCSPTNFATPQQQRRATRRSSNLFGGHNRFHDFAYFLGFTEENFNAQVSNFGNTGSGSQPRTAARATRRSATCRRAPSPAGSRASWAATTPTRSRSRTASPAITNQYLFQPIAGAFYSPCVDGDLDTTVFGHEYTHLISGRMVGGPDVGMVRRSRPARWARAGRTRSRSSTSTSTATCRQARRQPLSVEGVRTGNKQRPASATTRSTTTRSTTATSGSTSPARRSTPTARSGTRSATTSARRSSTSTRASTARAPRTRPSKATAPTGTRGPRVPRQPPLDLQIQFDAYLLQQSAHDDARRARRLPRGGPHAVRRSGPERAVERVRQRGMGQDASTRGTDDDRPGARASRRRPRPRAR